VQKLEQMLNDVYSYNNLHREREPISLILFMLIDLIDHMCYKKGDLLNGSYVDIYIIHWN